MAIGQLTYIFKFPTVIILYLDFYIEPFYSAMAIIIIIIVAGITTSSKCAEGSVGLLFKLIFSRTWASKIASILSIRYITQILWESI